MFAAFARTCEIKVDARGSMAGEAPEKNKINVMIKELWSIDIT